MKNKACVHSHRVVSIAAILVLCVALGAENAAACTNVTNMIVIGLSKDQVDGQPMKNPIGIAKDYNDDWETVAGRMFTNHFRYENPKSRSEPDRIVVEQRPILGGGGSRVRDGILSSSESVQVVFGYLKDGEIIKDEDKYDVYLVSKCNPS
jgi:hypothetical protein